MPKTSPIEKQDRASPSRKGDEPFGTKICGSRQSESTVCAGNPILQPLTEYAGPSPVAGVLYVDSRSTDFWLNDVEVREICQIIKDAIRGLASNPLDRFERLRNVRLSGVRTRAGTPAKLRADVRPALDLLKDVDPPITDAPFQFNFDVSDVTPLAIPAAKHI